jgi:hypothetical protein
MMGRRGRTWVVALAGGSLAGLALYLWQSRRRRAPVFRAGRTSLARDRSQLSWRFDHRFRVLPAGGALRIDVQSPAIVHWTTNQWDRVQDTRTEELEPDLHVAELPTGEMPPGIRVQFTFYWPRVNRWEGEDFEVLVGEATERTVRSATDQAE